MLSLIKRKQLQATLHWLFLRPLFLLLRWLLNFPLPLALWKIALMVHSMDGEETLFSNLEMVKYGNNLLLITSIITHIVPMLRYINRGQGIKLRLTGLIVPLV